MITQNIREIYFHAMLARAAYAEFITTTFNGVDDNNVSDVDDQATVLESARVGCNKP